jgi:hypothetical protein
VIGRVHGVLDDVPIRKHGRAADHRVLLGKGAGRNGGTADDRCGERKSNGFG